MRLVPRDLAVLAISIAGCVPARDNLHDPSNQPRVRAEIIDHTLADGRCAGDFSLAWPVVAAASRGRCLAVDARETTEPQGESVEKLDFSLALEGAPIAVVTSAGVLVIGSAALASLATDVVLELEVTAEDDSGAKGGARVSLVLLNPRPVAVAPPGRSLPTLGWPWSPPDGERVLFDATGSFDPDGIPLAYYCWSFGGAPEICRWNGDNPDFEREIEETLSGRLVVVDDKGTRSASSWTTIRVGPTPPWMVSYSSGVELVDEAVVLPLAGGRPLGYVGFGPSEYVLTDATGSNEYQLLLLGPPGMVPPGVAPPASVSIASVTSVGDGRFWTLEKEFTGGDPPVNWRAVERKVDLTGTSPGGFTSGAVVPLGTAAAPFPDNACLEGGGALITSDRSGRLWVASGLVGDLRVVDGTAVTVIEQGVVFVPPVTDSDCSDDDYDDRRHTAIASRPGHDEVWVALAPVQPDADDPFRLQVYSGSGALDAEVVLPSIAREIAWASPDELWVALPFDGVVLLDAPMLLTGSSFADAVLHSEPGLTGDFRFLADPLTGGAWAFQPGADLYRIEPGKGLRALNGEAGLYPQFVDRDGSLWMQDLSGDLRRARSVAPDQLAGRLFLPIPYGPYGTHDAATGWLWTPVSLGPSLGLPPFAIAAINADMTVARQIVSQVNGGVTEPLPALGPLRVSGDGRQLWYVATATSTLVRLDISVDPPVVLASTADPVIVASAFSLNLLEPSAPGGTGTWLWYYDDTTFTIHTIADSFDVGTVTAAFVLPVAERASPPKVAVLPATNRLCVLTRGSDSNYRLRYVEGDGGGGTATVRDTIPFVGLSNGIFVAGYASSLVGGESCWYALLTDGINPGYSWTVRDRFTGSGFAYSKTYLPAGLEYPTSLTPISSVDAWLTVVTPSFSTVRRRVDINGVDFDVPSTVYGNEFRGPFSSR